MVKEKTGVRLDGVEAINPVTGKNIPIFISDYVLATYGTGAIMAVPAHDGRDWEFAKKFGLPIVEVVAGGKDVQEEVYTDVATGTLVNSGFLNGKSVSEAQEAMIRFLEEKGIGSRKTNFKLRDWVFSRQRYWGEPIPLVNCPKCGWVAIPEKELPLTLPEVESYEPTETGESPLSKMTDWMQCSCPACGGPATRETDTMPQWAGSSWYFLRYCDPTNSEALASPEALQYWLPVDWYNGGMEHTTLHLLYSRFWSKFLYDIGVVPCKEPYAKRTSHGMILGENGEKMSKSRGNVVNPDDIVREYGADTFRLYEMFIGDFEKAAPWNQNSIKGCKRFLERFADIPGMVSGHGVTPELEVPFHKTIKKVTEDIDGLKANTAIAALMSLVNLIFDVGHLTAEEFRTLMILLCPFAPHLCEELWANNGGEGLCSLSSWPKYDEAKTVDASVEIALQVNGKLKGTILLPLDCPKEEALSAARQNEKIAAAVSGMTIVKEIFVPNKIINFVVRP